MGQNLASFSVEIKLNTSHFKTFFSIHLSISENTIESFISETS